MANGLFGIVINLGKLTLVTLEIANKHMGINQSI